MPRPDSCQTDNEGRNRPNASQIEERWMAPDPSCGSLPKRKVATHSRFQGEASGAEQIVAGVMPLFLPSTFLRQNDCVSRDLQLRLLRIPRHFLNDLPAAVAGRKIRQGMNACRVVLQPLFHMIRQLKNFPPVNLCQEAKAANCVGYRDLIGSLASLFLAYDLLQ